MATMVAATTAAFFIGQGAVLALRLAGVVGRRGASKLFWHVVAPAELAVLLVVAAGTGFIHG